MNSLDIGQKPNISRPSPSIMNPGELRQYLKHVGFIETPSDSYQVLIPHLKQFRYPYSSRFTKTCLHPSYDLIFSWEFLSRGMTSHFQRKHKTLFWRNDEDRTDLAIGRLILIIDIGINDIACTEISLRYHMNPHRHHLQARRNNPNRDQTYLL